MILSMGDLHSLCTACGTSAIFWIFWMIGTCDAVCRCVVSTIFWISLLVVDCLCRGRYPSIRLTLYLRCIVWIVGTWCCDTNLEIYDPANVLRLLSVVQHNGNIHSLIEELRWLDERRLGVRDALSQPSTRCRGLAATKN